MKKINLRGSKRQKSTALLVGIEQEKVQKALEESKKRNDWATWVPNVSLTDVERSIYQHVEPEKKPNQIEAGGGVTLWHWTGGDAQNVRLEKVRYGESTEVFVLSQTIRITNTGTEVVDAAVDIVYDVFIDGNMIALLIYKFSCVGLRQTKEKGGWQAQSDVRLTYEQIPFVELVPKLFEVAHEVNGLGLNKVLRIPIMMFIHRGDVSVLDLKESGTTNPSDTIKLNYYIYHAYSYSGEHKVHQEQWLYAFEVSAGKPFFMPYIHGLKKTTMGETQYYRGSMLKYYYWEWLP